MDEADVKKKKCELITWSDAMAMRATAAGSGVSGDGAMARVVAAQGRLDKAAPRAAQARAQSRLQAATNPRLWQPPLTLTE